MRSQAEMGVGGLISLLILIAIGALVLYEVTGALDIDTSPSVTLTLTDDNTTGDSTTLTITESVSSATLTSAFTNDNELGAGTYTITVQLNSENILKVTDDNVSSTENTVTALQAVNTIIIVNDNDNVHWTGTATLDVSTYVGSVVGNVEEKGETVFNLLTILAIVIVAALIIGVVIRAIGGIGGLGGRPAGQPAF